MALCRIRQERGSIVLETLLILPFFLTFFLMLSFLLSVAQTKLALQDAVDEAVKTAAAHAYPVDLLVNAYRNHPAVQQVQSSIDRFLPEEIKRLLTWNQSERGSGNGTLVFEGEQARWFDAWLVPDIISYSDRTASGQSRLKKERVTIRSVTLPDFLNEEGAYFGMTVEYTIPIPIPFIRGKITLVESSYERCWVGKK
jgi:predicted lipase